MLESAAVGAVALKISSAGGAAGAATVASAASDAFPVTLSNTLDYGSDTAGVIKVMEYFDPVHTFAGHGQTAQQVVSEAKELIAQAKDGLVEEAVQEAVSGAATLVTAATDKVAAVVGGMDFEAGAAHDAAAQVHHSILSANDINHRLHEGLVEEATRNAAAGQEGLADQGPPMAVDVPPAVSTSAARSEMTVLHLPGGDMTVFQKVDVDDAVGEEAFCTPLADQQDFPDSYQEIAEGKQLRDLIGEAGFSPPAAQEIAEAQAKNLAQAMNEAHINPIAAEAGFNAAAPTAAMDTGLENNSRTSGVDELKGAAASESKPSKDEKLKPSFVASVFDKVLPPVVVQAFQCASEFSCGKSRSCNPRWQPSKPAPKAKPETQAKPQPQAGQANSRATDVDDGDAMSVADSCSTSGNSEVVWF